MRARAIVVGFVTGAGTNAALVAATHGIWWPLVLVGVTFAVLVWQARRAQADLVRALAERREARKTEEGA